MDSNYDQLNDFLQDQSFVQWCLHDEYAEQWQAFMTRHPHKTLLLEEARQLIVAIYQAEAADIYPLDKPTIWANIAATLPNNSIPEISPVVVPFWRLASFRWAASLMLIGGVITWFYSQHQQAQQSITYAELVTAAQQKNQNQTEVSPRNVLQTLTLEDGTIVRLSKGSQLSYPIHFATDRREVILTGEAVFDVAKNPNRPFYVYAGAVVTKVLGTSFQISAFENARQVLVNVRSGKVSVYTQKRIDLDDPEKHGLVLLPNQQAIFDRTNESLDRRLISMPLPVGSLKSTEQLRFEDVPVRTVLQELARLYEIEIRYNEEVLAQCLITTTLHGHSLHDQLDLICQTIGATYKEIDAQIVIEAKGCR